MNILVITIIENKNEICFIHQSSPSALNIVYITYFREIVNILNKSKSKKLMRTNRL